MSTPHDSDRVDVNGPHDETRSFMSAPRSDSSRADEETRELNTPAMADSVVSGDRHRSVTDVGSEDDAAAEESMVGTSIGHFVVLGMLGRGGMGTVYEVFDRTLDRRVAVKLLHLDVAPGHQKRLIREAQALAQLSHPNVVQVYEVGEVGGRSYVAMELVQGQTLRQWIRQEPRPDWRTCVKVYSAAGAGLAAAHEQGLVHCDFKPANAIVDDKGRVRVLDFGLARAAENTGPERSTSSPESSTSVIEQLGHSRSNLQLTQSGAVMGTPAYMPPEQMQGREVDASGDQFSFCVSLYEALYGLRPFEGQTMAELKEARLAERFTSPPRGTKVPTALRDMLLRGLACDPAKRWPSMQRLLDELSPLVAPKRRRAIIALSGALVSGLALVGAGLAYQAEVGQRCSGALAQLDGVWDDARRQQVEDAILGTEFSYAPDTWARVSAQLDRYATAWADEHTEVCEATSVRQEQSAEVMDLRMSCLREHRVALRETVSVLTEATPTRLAQAVTLVESLPRLSRCDDLDALQAELPPPTDPQQALTVEALRDQIAQIRALRNAGAYDEALTEAQALVEQAEDVDHPPLLAEALMERGSCRQEKAEYEDAEDDLEQAYLLATQLEYFAVEAIAVRKLAFVVGHDQARHENGLQWAKTALALARGPRADPWEEAMVLSDIGITLLKKGELTEALGYHERALAIFEESRGAGHSDIADLLHNMGTVLRQLGKTEEALSHLRQALTIREEALGAHHPHVAHSLTTIGAVLKDQGKPDDALDNLLRALEIREDALGPDHPNVATSLNNIAILYKEQGKLEEALTHFQRALTIQEKVLGADHPRVAYPLNNIGEVLREQGKQEEALTYFERSLETMEKALGPDHPNVALSAINLGNLLYVQERFEDAQRQYRRAYEIQQAALPEDHPHMAWSLLGLAKADLKTQEFDDARKYAEQAVSIREGTKVPPQLLAEAKFILARSLWSEPSERARARTLAEQAREAWSSADTDDKNTKEYLADVQKWLDEHVAE